MTYEQLIASVDRVRFRTACATLVDEELASALCQAILRTGDRPATERLALLLRLFADLPLYSVIHAALELLPGLDAAGRVTLFNALAQALARERSAASEAVETLLFADLFADGALVDEAWAALSGPGIPLVTLRSVLRVSAQVPWRLKRTLFARLLAQPEWHAQLYLAVRGSRYALFGSAVDPEEARLVLEHLVLPGRERELEALRAALH
jgi:hypothetical protein